MASKPLNKANLTALGAEVLADLLLEAVKGDATRQRRVRMALAADDGPTPWPPISANALPRSGVT